jgi:transposase
MNEQRIATLREQFTAWAATADIRRLWFIDEAGSHIAFTPICGWAPRGQRLPEAVPRNRGTVTTMIGALTVGGVTALMTIVGGTSGDVFLAYVTQVLAPLLRSGDIVVLDNLAAHRIYDVQAAIEAVGASIKFLPPYSPDMMPKELSWSKIKTAMRRLKPRTREALDDAFATAAHSVTSSDARAWMRHCGFLNQPF